MVQVHVTLPDYYSPEHLGMIVPKTKDGRVVFMLPWQAATIAGTTGASLAPRLPSPCDCVPATHLPHTQLASGQPDWSSLARFIMGPGP